MKKIFVLDTNVLISDPMCFHRFSEHHIHIPFIVLEELDNHKRGHTDVARNAREATRQLESLMQNETSTNHYSINRYGGELSFTTKQLKDSIPDDKSNDNIIISETIAVSKMYPDRETVLVSRDINMRVKAKSLELKTEDYKADQVEMDDKSVIGKTLHDSLDLNLSNETIQDLLNNYHGSKEPNLKIEPNLKLRDGMLFCIHDTNIVYRVLNCYDDYCEVTHLSNYMGNHTVWGVRAKNKEQNVALNLLMDQSKHLVVLSGGAGCGKTILALASALEQTIEKKKYEKVLFLRETLTAANSEEIGFLPNDLKSKMLPWLGSLTDNLSQLDGFKATNSGKGYSSKEVSPLGQFEDVIEINSIGLMRGSSVPNTFMIIDEAQNLTNSQIKMLLTRVGAGTKVVMLGNVKQIDHPYLSASSNGMVHVMERLSDSILLGAIEVI